MDLKKKDKEKMNISKYDYNNLKLNVKVKIYIKSFINFIVEHTTLLIDLKTLSIKDYIKGLCLNIKGYYFNSLKYDKNYWEYLDREYKFLMITK